MVWERRFNEGGAGIYTMSPAYFRHIVLTRRVLVCREPFQLQRGYSLAYPVVTDIIGRMYNMLAEVCSYFLAQGKDPLVLAAMIGNWWCHLRLRWERSGISTVRREQTTSQ